MGTEGMATESAQRMEGTKKETIDSTRLFINSWN